MKNPTTYSYADLEALPQTSFTDTFQCVTGWRVPDVPWTGVRVADLLERAVPTAGAVGVRYLSFDGAYSANMTLERARADDVIVALTMYGEPVTHDHGGPVRIYSGSMYGYKGPKWLSEIEVSRTTIRATGKLAVTRWTGSSMSEPLDLDRFTLAERLGHIAFALRDAEARRGMRTGRVSHRRARAEHAAWADQLGQADPGSSQGPR